MNSPIINFIKLISFLKNKLNYDSIYSIFSFVFKSFDLHKYIAFSNKKWLTLNKMIINKILHQRIPKITAPFAFINKAYLRTHKDIQKFSRVIHFLNSKIQNPFIPNYYERDNDHDRFSSFVDFHKFKPKWILYLEQKQILRDLEKQEPKLHMLRFYCFILRLIKGYSLYKKKPSTRSPMVSTRPDGLVKKPFSRVQKKAYINYYSPKCVDSFLFHDSQKESSFNIKRIKKQTSDSFKYLDSCFSKSSDFHFQNYCDDLFKLLKTSSFVIPHPSKFEPIPLLPHFNIIYSKYYDSFFSSRDVFYAIARQQATLKILSDEIATYLKMFSKIESAESSRLFKIEQKQNRKQNKVDMRKTRKQVKRDIKKIDSLSIDNFPELKK